MQDEISSDQGDGFEAALAPEADAPDTSTEAVADEAVVEEQAEDTAVADEGDAAESETDNQGETDSADDDQSADTKDQARENYWKRQADKKDKYIADLEQKLASEYVGNAEDDTEKRVRTIEARQYLNEVSSAREGIVRDNERAQKEIPMFNPASPDFNQKAYERVMAHYANAYLVADENGEIIGAKAGLYDYLTDQAELFSEVAQSGARRGQVAEAKMRGAASVPSAAKAPSKEDDPFLIGLKGEASK